MPYKSPWDLQSRPLEPRSDPGGQGGTGFELGRKCSRDIEKTNTRARTTKSNLV